MTGHWKILTAFLLLTAAVTLTVVTVKGHTDNSGNTTEETGGGPYGSSEHISINEFLSNDLSSSSQFSALDSYIERFMKRWEIKGGSLAVMKDGQLIYSKDSIPLQTGNCYGDHAAVRKKGPEPG